VFYDNNTKPDVTIVHSNGTETDTIALSGNKGNFMHEENLHKETGQGDRKEWATLF